MDIGLSTRGEAALGLLARLGDVVLPDDFAHTGNGFQARENLLYDPERQIDVAWAGAKTTTYAIELEVLSDDRPGLLADLTRAIAGEGSNIRRIEARADEDRKGYVSVSLETSDLKHLEKILSRLKAVSGVREVIRKYNVPQAGERD